MVEGRRIGRRGARRETVAERHIRAADGHVRAVEEEWERAWSPTGGAAVPAPRRSERAPKLQRISQQGRRGEWPPYQQSVSSRGSPFLPLRTQFFGRLRGTHHSSGVELDRTRRLLAAGPCRLHASAGRSRAEISPLRFSRAAVDRIRMAALLIRDLGG